MSKIFKILYPVNKEIYVRADSMIAAIDEFEAWAEEFNKKHSTAHIEINPDTVIEIGEAI